MPNIKLFQDGPSLTEIDKYFNKVDGYTFNPSLFKKLGAQNLNYPLAMSIKSLSGEK